MKIARRTLLRGLAGAVVGLPLLPALLPRRARAQSIARPKRLVVFFHPNGVVPETWYPTHGASETEFQLGRSHEPLLPFKQRLVVLSGVDMLSPAAGPGEPHQRGMGGVLTGRALNPGSFVGGDGSLAGFASGISVDQRVAQAVGQTTRFPSLELGVRADASTSVAEPRSRLVYRGSDQPLPPTTDPRQLWARLFSDGAPASGAVLEAVAAQRRSVLDAVQEQLAALSARVPSDERLVLEQHLALVRDLEGRMAAAASPSLACEAPQAPSELPVDDEASMQQISRLQIDLLALALACDHTRVASLQYSNAVNHIRFPWLDSYGDGHDLSHAGPSSTSARDQLAARDRWYAGELAYLLGRLDAIPEGDGTLLDQTLVLWVNELSVGNVHAQTNMPFLLAGGCGGAIRTGRALRFEGASHNDLLLAVLRAFDVDDATFGDPDYCTGPLPGLLA